MGLHQRIFFITAAVILLYISECYGDINFEEHNQTMRISLHRQKMPLEQHLNSPLHKYGVTMDWLYKKPHPHPKPPFNRTNDTILLYRYLNHEFYGKIVIGHPGQTLNVAFDTTWSYSWVLSSYCNALTTFGCYMHNKYDHDKSSEYKPDGKKFNVDVGTFNLTGFYSYDNISITHSNITNFSFIEMVDVPNSFIFNKADGIMGLGMESEGDPYEPFFKALLRLKKIKESLFSIYIDRDHQSARGGEISLGFVNLKHVKSKKVNGKKVYEDILYKNVDRTPYWQFTIDKIVLVKKPGVEDIICPGNCTAIIDSSSSTIIGPVDAVGKIHYDIKATKLIMNRYSVDCEAVEKLFPITFMVGDKNFTLNGHSYVTRMTWKSLSICLSSFQPAETPTEQTRWVLGAAFLAEVYTIYDVHNKKIGLVHSA